MRISASQKVWLSDHANKAIGSTIISGRKIIHQSRLFDWMKGSPADKSDCFIREDVKSQPQSQRSAVSRLASAQCGQVTIAAHSPSQRLRIGW